MAKDFDVRSVTTTTIPDSVGTRSINLMCGILDGITYGELYESPFHSNSGSLSPLETIIRNINDLPPRLQIGATTGQLIVKSRLLPAFEHIKLILESLRYPNITLGELFHTAPRTMTPIEKAAAGVTIVTMLESVHDLDESGEDQMRHFCVPFLTVRYNRIPKLGNSPIAKRAPTVADLNAFLNEFRDKEMRYLYEKQTNGYAVKRKAAKDALDCCILKEYRTGNRPALEVMGHDGNSRYCTGTSAGCDGCAHPDDWCNDYYISGSSGPKQCTLGSDYH